MANSKTYGVIDSVKEGWQAIRRNTGGILAAFGIGLLIILGSILVLGLVIGAAILGGIGALNNTFLALLSGLIGVIVLVPLLFLFQAFSLSLMSLAFADGYHNKKSDVGAIVRQSKEATPRVAKAMLWVLWIVGAPVVVFGLVLAGLSFISSNPFWDALWLLIALVGGLVAFVWIVSMLLRYALVTYVALFEEKVAPRQTLNRSEQLLKNGGTWFVIKFALLYLAVSIVASIFTGGDSPNSGLATISNIVSTAVGFIAQAAFTAFYFNRAKHSVR